ncbi:hypothetical protein F5B21DRAFT_522512 [Xylaria acuta]|nr:hypothetical protein F5B21DRAFT_522512 [Xylaria acuta]
MNRSSGRRRIRIGSPPTPDSNVPVSVTNPINIDDPTPGNRPDPNSLHRELIGHGTRDSLHHIPDQSIVVIPCNCLGEWVSRFGKEAKSYFPGAHNEDFKHCTSFMDNKTGFPGNEFVGTSFIIPPTMNDTAANGKQIWLACLYISHGYGAADTQTGRPGQDKHPDVSFQTKDALKHFRRQLRRGDCGMNNNLRGWNKWGKGMVIVTPKFSSAGETNWSIYRQHIEECFSDWQGQWLALRDFYTT